MTELSLMTVLVIVLAVLGVVLFFRHWIRVERARNDEIRRRERLRILLRREDRRR